MAIVDNYWQTETGWPILSAQPGIEDTPRKFGSPSFPVYGYDVRLLREGTGEEAETDEKAVLTIMPPLPPGLHDHRLGRRRALRQDVFLGFRRASSPTRRSTGRRAIADGYYFVLGRTDDVINVAGHRLGTREIEEAVQAHSGIAEVAVVGVADPLKGQIAGGVRRRQGCLEGGDTPRAPREMRDEVMATVDRELGAIARPGAVHFVTLLPKTRSGKLSAAHDPGAGGGSRPGRPYDHRGSGGAGADPVRTRPAQGIMSGYSGPAPPPDMSDLSVTTAAIPSRPLPASAARHAPLAVVMRGDAVDSVHMGSVAVVDRDGRLAVRRRRSRLS